MGLGYTANEVAYNVTSITIIERYPTIVELCRCNPWSQILFNNRRITHKIGYD